MKLLLCLLVVLSALTTPLHAAAPVIEPIETATPVAGTVEANGITIAYESFGSADGETILLVAGTGMQLVDWPIELVDELTARGYRVVRFDNRDMGLSTKLTAAGLPDSEAIRRALEAGKPPPLPYTLRDMTKDVVGLLDALGIRRAHLAGVSMGGDIAQLVAIDYPDRMLSLTLLMADSGNPDLPVLAKPEAFQGVPPQPAAGDRAAYVAWSVRTMQAQAGPTYPTDEATLRAWAERNFERGYDPAGFTRQATAVLVDHLDPTRYRLNRLGRIEAPAVVLQGTEDPIVPVESARDLAARVPGAELRLIPGLGHSIPLALIPEFADAILWAAARAS